jgi:prevent-host-death family protein
MPENVIAAYEARTHFSELLARVEAGEEVTITRHGLPVARLSPIRSAGTVEERRAAIASMRELSSGLALQGVTVGELKNAGRR